MKDFSIFNLGMTIHKILDVSIKRDGKNGENEKYIFTMTKLYVAHVLYWGHYISKVIMGWTRSLSGRNKKCIQNFNMGNLSESSHSRDKGCDDRKLFKLTSGKYSAKISESYPMVGPRYWHCQNFGFYWQSEVTTDKLKHILQSTSLLSHILLAVILPEFH
jgi:hypothetical protein